MGGGGEDILIKLQSLRTFFGGEGGPWWSLLDCAVIKLWINLSHQKTSCPPQTGSKNEKGMKIQSTPSV